MACGCGKRRLGARMRSGSSKEADMVSGKRVIDSRSRILLVVSPIYDAYKDIIGYLAKDQEGVTYRIFPRNIIKILD